jgi:hypothetical protein
MSTLPHAIHPAVNSRPLSPKRSIALSEKRSLAILCFATASGLLSLLAALCATVLSSSAGGQYFWLAICLVTFGVLLIEVVRFGLSYQADKPGDAHLTAAKAQALASRITFHGVQMEAFGPEDHAELKAQREHLAYHLDRVLGELGVGLEDPAEGSPHNRPNGRTKWTEGSRQPSAG